MVPYEKNYKYFKDIDSQCNPFMLSLPCALSLGNISIAMTQPNIERIIDRATIHLSDENVALLVEIVLLERHSNLGLSDNNVLDT